MNISLPKAKAHVSYQTEILENGVVVSRPPARKNLVLDSGLDLVAAHQWHELIGYCAIGSGTTPTKRTLPAPNSIIANEMSEPNPEIGAGADDHGSFIDDGMDGRLAYFQASDVGRIVCANDGRLFRVKSVVNNPNYGAYGEIAIVKLVSGRGTPNTFYHVEQTQLDNELRRTGSNGSLDNSVQWDGPTRTMRFRRTFLFPVETKAVAYTEIGWSPSSYKEGAPLFGRDLISGGGDALTPNQQYRVTVDLHVTFDDTRQSEPDVELVEGWPGSTGEGKAEDVRHFHPRCDWVVFAARGPDAVEALRPLASDVYSALGEAVDANSNNVAPGYVAGSYELLFTNRFAGGSNEPDLQDIRAVGVRSGWYNYRHRCCFRFILDNPQKKPSTHELELTFRFSWDRVLS